MTVPVCINCHDLKDRLPLASWQPDVAFFALKDVWAKASPIERVIMAKLLAIICDASAQMKQQVKE